MKKKLSIILATGFSTIALAGAVAASAVTLTSCSEVTYLTDTNVNDMYTGIKDSGLFTSIDKAALPNNQDMVVALNDYFSGKKEASTEAKATTEGETSPGEANNQTSDTKPASVPEQLIKAAATKANVPENAIQAVVVTVKKTEPTVKTAEASSGNVQSDNTSAQSYQAEIGIKFGDADVSKLTKNDSFTLNSNRSEATFTTPIAITFKGDVAGTPPSGGGDSDHVGDVDASKINIDNGQAESLFTSLSDILTKIPESSVNTPSVSATTINTYLGTQSAALLQAVQKTNGITGIGDSGVVTGVTVTVTSAPTDPDGDGNYAAGTATVKIEFGPNKVNLSTAAGGNITVVGNDNTSLQQIDVAINITK